jgi:hypothetical protein
MLSLRRAGPRRDLGAPAALRIVLMVLIWGAAPGRGRTGLPPSPRRQAGFLTNEFSDEMLHDIAGLGGVIPVEPAKIDDQQRDENKDREHQAHRRT